MIFAPALNCASRKKNWKNTSNTVATAPTVSLPRRLRNSSGTVMLPLLRAT